MEKHKLNSSTSAWFLALGCLLLFAAGIPAQAATIPAASCSRADVQAAVNKAADGDIVRIPNGSAAWDGGIITTKQIRIEAQSYTPTDGGTMARGVVITNNSTTAPLFQFTSGNAYHVGIAGIRFNEGTGDQNHLRVQGTGSKVPLVNDCAFEVKDRYGNNPDISVLAWLSQGGVMWNSFVTGVCSGPAGQGCPLGAGILINSPRGWYTPSTMGSLDTGGMVNVYFEDCTFMNSGGFDVDDRGRLVVRRCLLDGTSGITHGFTSSWGGRHFEYYDNTFRCSTDECNIAGRYFWCRAGTGIFSDNAVDSPYNGYAPPDLLDIGDNTSPKPYPQSRQPGWGHNGTTDVIDPIYIWNNSGNGAYKWRISNGWEANVKQNREIYVNNGAKPGYAKYTYPHPLRGNLASLPEGMGLAAGYPEDNGIGNDSAVLFTEDFEGYSGSRISWSEIGGWDNVYGDMLITRTASNVHRGSQAVQITCTGTAQQSHGVVKQVAPQKRVFARWYMKFPSAFPGCHHTGLSVRGGDDGQLFANPTGTVPNGSNFFWVILDHLSPLHSWGPPENTAPPGWVYNYCYHMDQSSGYGDVLVADGDLNQRYPFSADFVPRANVTPQLNRWNCYELMVECNTVGARDGRVAIWIDGKLVMDHPGLRLRGIEKIVSRYISIGVYSSEVLPNQTAWYDDVVIAKQYIGPMATGGPGAPVAPTNLKVVP